MTICFDVKDEKEMRFGGAYYSASDLVKDKPTYIKSVVYNKKKSTTAVIWSDGTATKAVCNEHDTYNPEQGLLVAVMRKMCGREFVNKLLFDWSVSDDVISASDGVKVRTIKDVRKENTVDFK